jgi:hypothetical protein
MMVQWSLGGQQLTPNDTCAVTSGGAITVDHLLFQSVTPAIDTTQSLCVSFLSEVVLLAQIVHVATVRAGRRWHGYEMTRSWELFTVLPNKHCNTGVSSRRTGSV